jgi:hypothetical protein
VVDLYVMAKPTPTSGAPDFGGFDAKKAKGTWQLYVMDQTAEEPGAFASG